MEKYVQLAQKLNMTNAVLIGPDDIYFDIRVILKCRWGCRYHFANNPRCNVYDISYPERIEIIKAFKNILLVHSNNARALSRAVLEIERAAFLDGFYLASAIRGCNLCEECAIEKGENCANPRLVRPCDSNFGIDIFKTVRKLGLPCNVLRSTNEIQNRYGFVLIE